MTDRPILFSAPMIRALLDGRKTQTRRIAKFVQPQPDGFWHCHSAGGGMMGMDDQQVREWGAGYAPYAVGDRLWVKETHAYVGSSDPGYLLFRASDFTEQCDRYGFDKPYPPISDVKWTPSIFMRRKSSRLTLTVTDVRVERLQDCSESDALAEGVVWEEPSDADREWAVEYAAENGGDADIKGVFLVPHTDCGFGPKPRNAIWGCTAKDTYRFLWNSINGDGAWEQNPWIVAISFTVEKRNIDQ